MANEGDFTVIRQEKNDDCGLACFRNAMAYIYHRKNFALVKKINECANMQELYLSFKSYGIEAKGFIVDDCKALKKLEGPFILLLSKEEGPHFVFVKKRIGSFYVVEDPAIGKRLYTFRRLVKMKPRSVMTLNRTEFKEESEIELVKKKDRIISYLLSLGMGFLSIVGIVSLNNEKAFIWTWGALFGLAFLEWMMKAYGLSIQKRIDREIGADYMERNKSPEGLEKYTKFKAAVSSQAIKEPMMLVSAGVVMLSVSFSSFSFFLSLILSFAADFLFRFVFNREKTKTAIKASKEEALALQGEKLNREAFFKANSLARDYGKYVLLSKFFSCFFTLGFSFLINLSLLKSSPYYLFSEFILIRMALDMAFQPFEKSEGSLSPSASFLALGAAVYDCQGLYKKRRKQKGQYAIIK